MKWLATIALLFSLSSGASELDTMFDILKHVETNNKPIIGDNGKAFGIVQIHKLCVDDVNRIYGTSYEHADAWDETCAREIFNLYLQAGINLYFKKYNEMPTDEQVARMWNGGIYRGYRINATIKYARRYRWYKKQNLT